MTRSCLRKNLDASRPSEHPPDRGKNVKTFRWGHRLQIQNLFMEVHQTKIKQKHFEYIMK